MKRLALFTASLLLIGSSGLALAQDATPTAGNTPAPGTKIRNPKVKMIMDRFQKQESRIAMGVKNGKLTADEATALKDKLKAIHAEMKADFEQNKQAGQKGLTDDQIKQVNTELDANSTAIHDEKQGAAVPAASSSASTPTNP
jgi:hypothetical protein